jgi:hypothetical protein
MVPFFFYQIEMLQLVLESASERLLDSRVERGTAGGACAQITGLLLRYKLINVYMYSVHTFTLIPERLHRGRVWSALMTCGPS